MGEAGTAQGPSPTMTLWFVGATVFKIQETKEVGAGAGGRADR